MAVALATLPLNRVLAGDGDGAFTAGATAFGAGAFGAGGCATLAGLPAGLAAILFGAGLTAFTGAACTAAGLWAVFGVGLATGFLAGDAADFFATTLPGTAFFATSLLGTAFFTAAFPAGGLTVFAVLDAGFAADLGSGFFATGFLAAAGFDASFLTGLLLAALADLVAAFGAAGFAGAFFCALVVVELRVVFAISLHR